MLISGLNKALAALIHLLSVLLLTPYLLWGDASLPLAMEYIQLLTLVQVVPRVFGTSMLERFWAEWPLSEADNGELPLVSVCGQWVLGSTYGRTVFLPSLTSADFSQRFCSKNSLIVLILEISDSIPSMLAVIGTIAITSATVGDVKGCWIILSFM